MPKLIKKVGNYEIKQPEQGSRRNEYYIINENGDYLNRNGKTLPFCNDGWFSSVIGAEHFINTIQPPNFFKRLINKLFGGENV